MNQRIFAAEQFARSQPASCRLAAQKKRGRIRKTPWGDPDLQGTWTSDDTWGVPMERPVSFGDRSISPKTN